MQENDPQNMPQQAGVNWRQFMPGEEEEIDLAEYFGVLLDARWKIAGIALAFTLLAGAYAFLATPVYQADALLQVEQKESQLAGMDQLDALFSTQSPTDAEIEIIQSRTVLGQVVDKLKLDIQAQPDTLPLIGRIAGKLGLVDEESIDIGDLQVPDDLLNTPLTLTVTDTDHYTLTDDEGTPLLNGVVGERSEGHGVSIFVRELVAASGSEFEVVRRRTPDVIQALKENLKISEKGDKTGILQIIYNNDDPQQAKAVVDTLARTYLRQNVERKSAEAEKALHFLQQQLPTVKEQLDEAESALNRYRLKRGSVDISMQTQAVLDQAVDLQKQLSQLQMKRSDLRQRYTDKHPLVKAVDEQMARVRQDKQQLDKQIKALPETEQELIRLTRNVKVNTELYTFLLNKSQELKISRASTIGNVRILDFAVLPYKPVKPKKALILALGLVLGLFAGVLFVFIRQAMNRTIEDPDVIEQQTGLPVYAGIPHSEQQEALYKTMRHHKGQVSEGHSLLAQTAPNDMAIESLRSLRTNLHFALMDAANNRVVITGASPDIGKSFVSANFAAVLADAGQKVLIVDADMRKGHLHEYFGRERGPGLSDVVAGDLTWGEAVQKTGVEGLDLLASGTLPPNPSELLMHKAFHDLMAALSAAYDVVLIDTPPVLAVTDAVIIGRQAGTLFLQLCSGRHPLREVEQAIKYLKNGGIQPQGCIFNDIMPRSAYYGYSRYGYHYQYKYGSEKQ